MSVASVRTQIESLKSGRADVVVLFSDGCFETAYFDDAAILADVFDVPVQHRKYTDEPVSFASIQAGNKSRHARLRAAGYLLEIVPPDADTLAANDGAPVSFEDLSPAMRASIVAGIEKHDADLVRITAIRARLALHLTPDQIRALSIPSGAWDENCDAKIEAFERVAALLPESTRH